MTEIKKIYSNRCFIEGVLQPATIEYADGKITAIDFQKLSDATDLGNNIIMPGVIDAHVHVNEPGRTSWEGFETATQAAVAGGITTLADMPLNASPVTTTIEALTQKIKSTDGKLSMNIVFYGGLIPENINEQLSDLLQSGIRGIKCFLVHSGIDEFPNVSKSDLEMAMPIIAKYNIPLLAHCEMYDEDIETGLSADIGNYSKYLASRPKKWENDAIQMMIELSLSLIHI
jgi:allantoinase